jgi:hypothetical protein
VTLIHELSRTDEHIDPGGGETMRRVVGADVGAQSAHPPHDRGEINLDISFNPNTELACTTDARRGATGADERFRGHATDVETVTAHEVFLDESHFGTETGSSNGRDETGGAGAEHDEVVPTLRLRVHPIARVNVRNRSLVVLVPRFDSEGIGQLAHAFSQPNLDVRNLKHTVRFGEEL